MTRQAGRFRSLRHSEHTVCARCRRISRPVRGENIADRIGREHAGAAMHADSSAAQTGGGATRIPRGGRGIGTRRAVLGCPDAGDSAEAWRRCIRVRPGLDAAIGPGSDMHDGSQLPSGQTVFSWWRP